MPILAGKQDFDLLLSIEIASIFWFCRKIAAAHPPRRIRPVMPSWQIVGRASLLASRIPDLHLRALILRESSRAI